jgi:hypothetical protein
MCEQIIVNARFEGLSSGNAVSPDIANSIAVTSPTWRQLIKLNGRAPRPFTGIYFV